MTPDEFHKNTIADGYLSGAGMEDEYAPVPTTNPPAHDFATIPADAVAGAGLLPLPIRLRHGRHAGFKGYGIAHILAQHGCELVRQSDYWSAQDLVADAALHFQSVVRSDTSGRLMLVVPPEPEVDYHRILIVELARDGSCYTVVTCYLREGDRRVKGTLVWERRVRSSGLG